MASFRDLPVPERLALIERIWDSIVEDDGEFPLTDAQKAELDRRLARRKSLGSQGSPWAEVEQRLIET